MPKIVPVTLVCIGGLLLVADAVAQTYSFRSLGAMPGFDKSALPVSINDSGDILMKSGAIFSRNGLLVGNVPVGGGAEVIAMNNTREVVGHLADGSGLGFLNNYSAARWRASSGWETLRQRGGGEYSIVSSINNLGEVFGQVRNEFLPAQPFGTFGGEQQFTPLFAGTTTPDFVISNDRQNDSGGYIGVTTSVLGGASKLGYRVSSRFQGGILQELARSERPNIVGNTAYSINESGWVGGVEIELNSARTSISRISGTLWTDPATLTLVDPSVGFSGSLVTFVGDTGFAFCTNFQTTNVLNSQSDSREAFIWTSAAGSIPISSLVSNLPQGQAVDYIIGGNGGGDLIGFGRFGAQYQSFVLTSTAVPEPATLLILGLSSFTLLRRTRSDKARQLRI